MENLLDKKQVAELLNISVKTLDIKLSKGQGPRSMKLGRLVRFTQSDVQDFIQKQSEGN